MVVVVAALMVLLLAWGQVLKTAIMAMILVLVLLLLGLTLI